MKEVSLHQGLQLQLAAGKHPLHAANNDMTETSLQRVGLQLTAAKHLPPCCPRKETSFTGGWPASFLSTQATQCTACTTENAMFKL
jgi:hypothetical protein